MTRARRTHTRLARGAIVIACALAVAGCGGVSFVGGGSVELRSFERGSYISPRWQTAVYTSNDPNDASIYLSDIPLDSLRNGAPDALDNVSGNILHIRMFLQPKAGRTPIDFQASNVTIRHIVIAPGTLGVYGGGGFLLPSGKPGDSTFGGTVRRATLRLTDAAPGFADRLGSSEMSGRVSARLDSDASEAIARAITNVLARRAAAPVPE